MRAAAPEDMDPMTLECLEQLQLAQAQECFWHKAVKGDSKDALIAKLAAKVSDSYSQASDWGIKSEAIRSDWIHHMTAKHHHFAAAAQYRAGRDCLEKRKYGEEVARLRDSLACANEGLKESRYVSKSVSDDLSALKNKVQDDLERAEKDNDMIYLIPVPSKPELNTLERTSVASLQFTKELTDPVSLLGDSNKPGVLGKPLFSKLVPYAVHFAASIYASRRDQTINGIVEELESLTTRIHELLRSLNLPGSLQALEKPLGLPPGLVSHAEEIRQQNAPARLSRMLEDIKKLKNSDFETFSAGVKLLENEASDDDAASLKYGTDRWNRLDSETAATKLYSQVNEINGYFSSAESSDKMVRDKLKDNDNLIRLLNETDRDLEEYIPSSRRVAMTPRVEQHVNRLREMLSAANRTESNRRRKTESLRSKAQSDDVNPDLMKEASRLERQYPMRKVEAAQFEEFFDRRLERYNADLEIPKLERREQDTLLSKLAEANTALKTERQGDRSTRDREQRLQELENAYFAYREAVQNLDTGRKFYNELATVVAKFRDECRSFAYARQNEAAGLETDITTALPMANLSIQHQQPQEQSGGGDMGFVSGERRSRQQRYHGQSEEDQIQHPTLAAPTPVKPKSGGLPPAVANANASTASPSSAKPSSYAAPTAGTWNPDTAIKFAPTASSRSVQQQQQHQANGSDSSTYGKAGRDSRWDPGHHGIRFG